jgi:hypothetical protein
VWKSFLVGHHIFMDLPSDQCAIQFDMKKIALDSKRRVFFVIQIGQVGDLSPLKSESQLQMDCLPPPNQFSQTSTTEILLGHRASYCAPAR